MASTQLETYGSWAKLGTSMILLFQQSSREPALRSLQQSWQRLTKALYVAFSH